MLIRIEIARARGSTPRGAGTVMYVGEGVEGSIGGGALEYMALDAAREMLRTGADHRRLDVPLGPEIGQCCGGRVTLELTRVAARDPAPVLPQLLILGAGHVGRALARAALPMPLDLLLIDQRAEELARAEPAIPQRLTVLPEAEIRAARPGAAVVVTTHDHALDFMLAADALRRGDCRYVGMIGSATKRASFARHARAQGLDPAPLVCPMGAGYAPDKRPEVIAAFVLAEILVHMLAPAALPACAPPTGDA